MSRETFVQCAPGKLLRRSNFDVLPYLFVAPILLLLLVVSFYPGVYSIWLSLTNANLLRLARAEFIGLANFSRLFGDDIFVAGLWRTLRWDIVVVGVELAIALPMALFLNLRFRGRGMLRATVLVPYIIPPAVTALLFVYAFDGSFGVVNDLLVRAGIQSAYVPWLSEPIRSFSVIAGAMVWEGTPLMAIILLAVLQTIPSELYDAAAIDGAGSSRMFRHIILPHLMPTILLLALLRTIWMSNHIDMIFIMTRGGPGFANYTEAIYSFMLTGQFDIGYASAVALVLAALLIVASIAYVRHLARTVLT